MSRGRPNSSWIWLSPSGAWGLARASPLLSATAQWLLAHGQIKATCLTLTAFNLEVKAQSARRSRQAQATALITDATRIRAVLGC